MLVVLAVKKITVALSAIYKRKETYLFVVLVVLPKFGFTPRKIMIKVSCGFF